MHAANASGAAHRRIAVGFEDVKEFAIPVASEELLKKIRDVDSIWSSSGIVADNAGAKWPEICVTRVSDSVARLSFCGADPLRREDFPGRIE